MIARLLPLLLLAVAVQARAGVTFEFATAVSGTEYAYGGRMSIDGTSSRLDITTGTHPLFNPNFSIITRRGGKEIVVLDHGRRTYFVRKTEQMGGHLSATRGVGKASASRPQVRVTREGDRWRVSAQYRLSMDVEGERVAGTVELEAMLELDDVEQKALPWGLQFAAKTGFEDVDDAIARKFPDRLPLRQVVTASRRIADGPAITETITTTIANVAARVNVDPELFLAPRGYRYEEPVFAFAR
jgi:hypothetical protein